MRSIWLHLIIKFTSQHLVCSENGLSKRNDRCQLNKNIYKIGMMPAWISDYIANIVWDEITYPFLNFTVCTGNDK